MSYNDTGSTVPQTAAVEPVIIGCVQLPMGVTHLSISELPSQSFNQPIGIQGASVRDSGRKDTIINITTVFSGAAQINGLTSKAPFADIRSLIVELRSIPFLPIYSTDLANLVNGVFPSASGSLGSGSLNPMGAAITVAVQSVRISAIAGHARALQVDMSFALTNISLVTGGLVLFNDDSNGQTTQTYMYSSKKITNMILKLRSQNTKDFVFTSTDNVNRPMITLNIDAARGIEQYTRYISQALNSDVLLTQFPSLQKAMNGLQTTLKDASAQITNSKYQQASINGITNFSAMFSNTLVPVKMASSYIPVHQYLGSSPVQFQFSLVTDQPEFVAELEALHNAVLNLTNKLWFFHGYLPLLVTSSLTQLFNVNDISILQMDVGSLDDSTRSYNVQINAVSNDITDYIEQLNQAGYVDPNEVEYLIAQKVSDFYPGVKSWFDVTENTGNAVQPGIYTQMMKLIGDINYDNSQLTAVVAADLYMLKDKTANTTLIQASISPEQANLYNQFVQIAGGLGDGLGTSSENQFLAINNQKVTLTNPNGVPADAVLYKVDYVIDGDTIDVFKPKYNGNQIIPGQYVTQKTSVRFADIDAQEILHDPYTNSGSTSKPVGPYGIAATNLVQQIVNENSGTIYLKEFGADVFGRTIDRLYGKYNGQYQDISYLELSLGLAVPEFATSSQAYTEFAKAYQKGIGVFENYNSAPILTSSLAAKNQLAQYVGDTLPSNFVWVQFTPTTVRYPIANYFAEITDGVMTVKIPNLAPTMPVYTELSIDPANMFPILVYGALWSDYSGNPSMIIYLPQQIMKGGSI